MPSEIQANLDQPYILCSGDGTTKTHFRYQLLKTGTTIPLFTSDSIPIGTSVLHPTLSAGSYNVLCFYGTAASVDTTPTNANSCEKTMVANTSAQGCSRIYNYHGNTLSDEMTSTTPFNASFRCSSRLPDTNTTSPYLFRFGLQAPINLDYDTTMSSFLQTMQIGSLSQQTSSYNLPTGTTDISCAAHVGEGYSTNSSCRVSACVGDTCNTPQTFLVINSGNEVCSPNDQSSYTIGCNPAAPQSVRDACVAWFQNAFNTRSDTITNTFTTHFTFDGSNTLINCTKYPPGVLPGGINLVSNYMCTTTLQNGKVIQIYAADSNGPINSLQTTATTVKKDGIPPTIDSTSFQNAQTGVSIDTQRWQKTPVTMQVICHDTPLDDGSACACATTVDPASSNNVDWSAGTPDGTFGPDVMRYTRVIAASAFGQNVDVRDTAANASTPVSINIGIDTQAPTVTFTDSSTAALRDITLLATDTNSRIWKTTTAPNVGTNTAGIVFQKIPLSAIDTSVYPTDCGISAPTYATVTDTSASVSAQVTIPHVDTTKEAIAYCVQDNA